MVLRRDLCVGGNCGHDADRVVTRNESVVRLPAHDAINAFRVEAAAGGTLDITLGRLSRRKEQLAEFAGRLPVDRHAAADRNRRRPLVASTPAEANDSRRERADSRSRANEASSIHSLLAMLKVAPS